jgi:hypothetical protein
MQQILNNSDLNPNITMAQILAVYTDIRDIIAIKTAKIER